MTVQLALGKLRSFITHCDCIYLSNFNTYSRWLVHCIAWYYGLHTWSVTSNSKAGEPRREAYVGFGPATGVAFSQTPKAALGVASPFQPGEELPEPLWTQL